MFGPLRSPGDPKRAEAQEKFRHAERLREIADRQRDEKVASLMRQKANDLENLACDLQDEARKLDEDALAGAM